MNVEKLIKQGENAITNKNYEEALKFFSAAKIFDSQNMKIVLKIAALHFELKNYNDCISICKEAIKIGIENDTDFKDIGNSNKFASSYPIVRNNQCEYFRNQAFKF